MLFFGFVHFVPRLSLFIHIPPKKKHSTLVLIVCFSSVGQFYALEYTCGQAEAVVSADVPRNTAASSADYGKIIQELESHRQELFRLHLDYSLSQGVCILSLALSHVLSFPLQRRPFTLFFIFYISAASRLSLELSFLYWTYFFSLSFLSEFRSDLSLLFTQYVLWLKPSGLKSSMLSVTSTSHTRLFLTLCTLLVVTLSCLAMSVSNQSLNS